MLTSEPVPCSIIWTKSMWRLYFLVKRCYELREPVLLVGETGGGKTTVCQLLSIHLGSKLHILNCHQYTETSDFLGVGIFYILFVSFCFVFLLQCLLEVSCRCLIVFFLIRCLIILKVISFVFLIGVLSCSREIETYCKI